MAIDKLRPILWTDALAESIAFYTEVLEFNLDEFNEAWGWASLSKDKIGLMFAKPNVITPFEGCKFSGSFYYNVDDVEQLWSQLKDKVHICYDIETFEWGMREFAIYDNNGYILQCGQPVN